MKKPFRYITLFFVILFGTTCLFSYPVNILGQRVEGDSEYDMVGPYIYKNGMAVKKTEQVKSGELNKIVNTDLVSGIKVTSEYKNNLIIKKTTENGDQISEDNFYYNKGLLSSVITYINGKVVSKCDYLTDGLTGSLTAINKMNQISFFSDGYFSSKETVYRKVGTGLIPVKTEKGTTTEIKSEGELLTVTNNGIIYTYSPAGLVIHKTDGNKYYDYIYEKDGTILTETEIEENEKRVITYSDGLPITEENYINDLLEERINYGKEVIHEIFRDGKIYAKVYYGAENQGINRVEYIK